MAMKRTRQLGHSAGLSRQGYSLVELAMVIAAITVLAAGGAVALNGFIIEDASANSVMSFQSSLQTVISQAITRCHQYDAGAGPFAGCDFNTTGTTINQNRILNVVRVPNGVTITANGAGAYTMNFDNSARSAQFQTQANGNVNIVSVNNFGYYEPQNGDLRRCAGYCGTP